MKTRLAKTVLLCLVLLTILSGCGTTTRFDLVAAIDANIGVDASTRRTVGDVNETIRSINESIQKGIGVTPETQKLVEDLNSQIGQFNKTGVMGKEGLEEVRRLTGVLDRGLKVGLDAATLEMLNDFADTIDAQPEKWGAESSKLVDLLGRVGTKLSGQIADDMSKLTKQITSDMGGLAQTLGQEGRCTIDYSGQVVDRTIAQAGGKFIAGILPFLKDLYDKKESPAQIPGICTIEPSELQLVWRDGTLVPDPNSRIIRISGFNFSNEFPPTIRLLSEDETSQYNVSLVANRETSYKLTVNLQTKTFTDVTPGSKILFVWSDVVPDGSFRKTLLVQSILKPIANFSANTTAGSVPLTVQFIDASAGEPTLWFWDFGDGGTSTDQSPTHAYGSPGTYTVRLTVDNQFRSPNTKEETAFIKVMAPPAPQASFVGTPRDGQGPLRVSFEDRSTGNPISWLWDFGDGSSSASRRPPLHEYSADSSYTVRLTVRDAYGGEDTHEEVGYVIVRPRPTPVPTPTSTPTTAPPPTATPTLVPRKTWLFLDVFWDQGGGVGGWSEDRKFGQGCSPRRHRLSASAGNEEGQGWCAVQGWVDDDPHNCQALVHVGMRPFQGVSCHIIIWEEDD